VSSLTVWLVTNGHNEEASAMFIKSHANEDENNELVTLDFQQIRGVIETGGNKTRQKDPLTSLGNWNEIFILDCLGCFNQLSGNILPCPSPGDHYSPMP
jgi:hypothetical protein